MLTLLFIILLATGIIFSVLGNVQNEEGWFYGSIAPYFVSIILLVAIVLGTIDLSQGRVIDNKIAMYQEENTRIETTVTTTVEKYLEHEYQIFDSLQGEDIQTLLVVYPEINSNELVKRQVEIFVENNNKIKELKEQKLNIEVWKFWVYFG